MCLVLSCWSPALPFGHGFGFGNGQAKIKFFGGVIGQIVGVHTGKAGPTGAGLFEEGHVPGVFNCKGGVDVFDFALDVFEVNAHARFDLCEAMAEHVIVFENDRLLQFGFSGFHEWAIECLGGFGEGDDVGGGRQGIEGAGDGGGKLGDAVQINLRGFDAVVAEEFLHLGDAGSVCQEVGGEAVSEGVGGDAFVEPGFAGGEFEGFAEGVLVDVMTAEDAGAWIGGFIGGGPEPEPWPFAAAVGVFAL